MNNIELITKKEWEDFLETQDKIRHLVMLKTAELSMIKYGRLPDGKDVDFDLKESEFEPGCIFVEYEEYHCGESCKDQYNLPFEFLWDKDYPTKYKEIYEEKKRKLNEHRIEAARIKTERDQEAIERYDKKEYERLKKKFEGSD